VTTKELLFDEIDRAPLETARASEAVLAKDWLRPEEDEAWQSL
jgi:hypothetical protein